ncbi:hypothetical protein RRG08_042446 [Elysia crispata]|uniref:Uncharacterized protein n=1 Tax=Elysia crispata TaxID=231223 RepID=A0AAE0ZCA5_9GAST|nr:hypothetical protein RRG08_042446 [Elysia crispata]
MIQGLFLSEDLTLMLSCFDSHSLAEKQGRKVSEMRTTCRSENFPNLSMRDFPFCLARIRFVNCEGAEKTAVTPHCHALMARPSPIRWERSHGPCQID